MTMAPLAALAELLARTRYLLLDFDGPVCSIFANYPTRKVVLELTKLISDDGAPIPAAVTDARDPFDVLRYAATVNPKLTPRIEAQLRASEIRATRTAAPTPHAADVISAWRAAGRPVAIISNNSAEAVERYLTKQRISVDLITARRSADPALLKPNPHLLNKAVRELDANPRACALVGDSTTDITAAHHAGVPSVGYANKPGKRRRLTEAGADAVIDDMHALAHVVVTTST